MKFLNLKSFHPSNKANQKRLYIAEQRAVTDKKREEERAKEVKEEHEYFTNKAALASSYIEAQRSKVGFLYAAPPGLSKLEMPMPKQDLEDQREHDDSTKQGQGQGQGKNHRQMTDVEKFPFLANAPVQGGYSSDVKMTHKPFGIELRDVRCIRCNQWGHKSGDRDCLMRDINPNDLRRQEREDPLSAFNMPQNDGYNDGGSGHSKDQEVDDDDDSILREFLAGLTKRQRKLLLKQIKKEEKAKKKKDRSSKRRNSDDDESDSSGSSSSDNDSGDDKRRHRKKPRQ
ncbi:hypothetical protein SAMD00019534_090110 [Acytostelium subglobosum LB1]|uniref:hypothetical protein n=1 Tax=Acytostelium subglobosum LB1 TaxID=1410327 RepID=UPI000644F7D5|nr:hypothetical protein SAMD00019534_090110 [Acytostelium subglobosum LB1]GAM25836.1 hypothetical protein SAMD00019534_090110 [Acytostelium subglobosum LB1]|eukprot:XP_012751354.1 hypothetical protein SAMD00019534_090110 [Acytostelium subglobosum LB1]